MKLENAIKKLEKHGFKVSQENAFFVAKRGDDEIQFICQDGRCFNWSMGCFDYRLGAKNLTFFDNLTRALECIERDGA